MDDQANLVAGVNLVSAQTRFKISSQSDDAAVVPTGLHPNNVTARIIIAYDFFLIMKMLTSTRTMEMVTCIDNKLVNL